MRNHDVNTQSSGEARADRAGDGSPCTCCGAECCGCLFYSCPAWCPTVTKPGAALAILLCCVGVLLGVLSASVLPWLDPSNRALPGACVVRRVVEARASRVPLVPPFGTDVLAPTHRFLFF